ncbi:hypothetical protein DM02DRAFT_618373 [Periconia macrospinosa]|uniref:Uncharacterized protein n=1 Tax=Periconia macrospinosa TaxID=97972 RepID=A0A2V1D9S9_9PLEO|nr:hypothetical protein DM02DRAFT_618373 [Periconia macrospinosa]
MQQTLVIKTRIAEQHNTAWLPRTQSFSKFGMSGISKNSTRSDLRLLGVLYGGLFDRQSDLSNSTSFLDVSPTCPTGNCTFPRFTSLAICSRCENKTAAVDTACEHTIVGNPPREKVEVCVSTFRKKSNKKQPPFIQQVLPENLDEDDTDINLRRTVSCISTKANFTNYNGDILTIHAITGETKANGRMPVEATTCTLYFCTNQYEASVIHGKLQETITRSEQLQTPRLTSSFPDFHAYYTWQDSQGLDFMISRKALKNLSKWLEKFLTFSDNDRVKRIFHLKSVAGVNQGSSSKGGNRTAVIDPTQPNSTIIKSENALPAEEGMISLFITEAADQIISSIARGLSTYIRSCNKQDQKNPADVGGGGGAVQKQRSKSMVGPVQGVAHTLEVFVAVRWAWLAFPGAHLVLTWSFFVMVVIYSTKNNVSVWKSSPLALLYHGLSDDVVQELRHETEVNKMERTARDIHVQLKDSGSGLHLDRSG